MGTQGLFVFRIRGKVVARVRTQGDGYPAGFPKTIAKLLYELEGEVQVHKLIISIVAAIKDCVGAIYMTSSIGSYDVEDDWPFIQYCYTFDFDEEIKIECREICGESKIHDVPRFSSLCENEISTDYAKPTLKYDAPIKNGDNREFVVMLNEDGEPFFVLAVKEWTQTIENFVLDVKLCNGISGPVEIGRDANGSDCLAAQILRKVHELCLDAEIIPVDALEYPAMPLHTICLYKLVPDMIAVHEEGNGGTFPPRDVVQGIHSITESGSAVKKARYVPPRPRIKRKRESPKDDDEKSNDKKNKHAK